MQILKLDRTLAFMSLRIPATILSVLLIVGTFVTIGTKGMNMGLDFTGGTLVEVAFSQPADLNKVRSELEKSGFGDAVVQNFGSAEDVLVRLPVRETVSEEDSQNKAAMLGNQVYDALKSMDEGLAMRRTDYVGPSVGQELTEQGGLAMLTALMCILVYVAFRFEWRFALGSVIALAHDVIITVGLFALVGLEFDLTVLAAILAVIGYSLNDTIVVSDRIRENFRKIRKGTTEEIINISLTQTLSRTIITSVTTILVLLALFIYGGELIKGFSAALLFGVVIGTYSSIYVASSVALSLGISKEDLIPVEVEKEGADLDALP